MAYVLVVLDRDAELVPGRTKAQLRAIAAQTQAALDKPEPMIARTVSALLFTPAEAEAGIAAREARKSARAAA